MRKNIINTKTEKMIRFTLVFIISFLGFINIYAQNTAQLAYKETILTSKRSEILLNNLWLFQPAEGNAKDQPLERSWKKIQVPSSWAAKNSDDIDYSNVNRAWYQTNVMVPVSWKNRLIELELTKVSTDAIIYVNGIKAGQVSWYTGLVDVSKYLKFGQTNTIKILVISTPNEGEIPVLMGTATDQVTFTKATLDSRGIIGDILLSAKPKQSYITDVFVQPSLRKRNVSLDVELTGIKKAGKITVVANMLNEKGTSEKVFTTEVRVEARETQLVKLSFDWDNPRLWDLDRPELYKLKLKVSAPNILEDEYLQEFGFREFWIEGKNFYLNGSVINLRPQFVGGKGMDELIDASIAINRKNGFNISEIWPNNFDKRGFVEHSEQIMARSDKKGYLIMGVALPFVAYLVDKNWSFIWDEAHQKADYEKRMLINLRRERNHPSVVMWVTSGNFFGHFQDQNPLNIGMTNWVTNNVNFQRNAKAGKEALDIIKKHDPTRPVTTHHGTYVGDVHTLNFYLDLIPLQEREEWMSFYADHGQLPFIGIEFGTPLFCTFLRGRNGFGNNIKSEPLVTEFASMYFGSKAYTKEPVNYRMLLKDNFIEGQTYKGMDNPPTLLENMWSFQQVQALFIKNTWRSYRSYGMPGGLLPWTNGHGWSQKDSANTMVNMKPFETGRRGMYYPTVRLGDLKDFQSPAYTVQPAGQELIKNNNETLAYIAGSSLAFTAKDHSFKTDEQVEKQLFFFNDTREIQTCKWASQIKVEGKIISSAKGEELIPIGGKKSSTIYFTAPPKIGEGKVDGEIVLKATIGTNIHVDTFKFRVFRPEETKGDKEVYVFDPVGKTSTMLMALGYDVKNWNGEKNMPFLIIGREVISKNYKLPFSLENYIKDGGKAIVFNQQDSVLERSGFRLSKFVSRYVFPINHNKVTGSLDEYDLRDWRGVGTLIKPYPDYMNTTYEKSPDGSPLYGWHWGNRGSVATNAIEKPHNSGWTPLLECEFDMAYSPLLELNYGNGKLIWCSLDLEDHAETDPVAEKMTKQLIHYAQTLSLKPRNKITLFLGNEQEKNQLDEVGLVYQFATKVQKNADLIICGTLDVAQQNEVINYVKAGGKILVLPRSQAQNYLGVMYGYDQNFEGGKTIPDWEITQGLSLSDVRYKTTMGTVKITEGCQTAIDGLVGQKKLGKGNMVFCQIDPSRFNADSLTYFRYTRWRSNRAVVQILANLGAEFICDQNIFKREQKSNTSVDLDKTLWKAKMTLSYPGAKSIDERKKDPGITAEALLLVKEVADETGMLNTNIPMTNADELTDIFTKMDGEAVFRKTIEAPDAMVGKDLLIRLSAIDDFDQVYINGTMIGFTDDQTSENWSFKRTYTIPSHLVKAGKNVIAIRVFDWYGGGGFFGTNPKREIVLKVEPKIKPVKLYHLDYRVDFELGDNPFRYYRW